MASPVEEQNTAGNCTLNDEVTPENNIDSIDENAFAESNGLVIEAPFGDREDKGAEAAVDQKWQLGFIDVLEGTKKGKQAKNSSCSVAPVLRFELKVRSPHDNNIILHEAWLEFSTGQPDQFNQYPWESQNHKEEEPEPSKLQGAPRKGTQRKAETTGLSDWIFNLWRCWM